MTIKAEPLTAVLADIARRFEVLDVAYLNDFIGPCQPSFYAGIQQALQPKKTRYTKNEY